MTTPEPSVGELIATSAQPAVDAIFDGIQEADFHVKHLSKQGKRMAALNNRSNTKFKTDVFRYFVLEYLRANSEDLGDWTLNEQIGMNSIILHRGLQTIRLSHTQRRDVIPAAGRNESRINYYSSSIAAADPDALIDEQNLILTWHCWAPTAPMRLVHTLTAGSYARNPKIDFSCLMHRSDEDFSGYSFDFRSETELEDVSSIAFDSTGTGSD
jgi:hypothetical protein